MILNSKPINDHIKKVQEIAAYLWEKGWAERNAGNISINLSGLADVDALKKQLGPFVQLSLPSEAAGMILFVTGTGERLRDLRTQPEKAACILMIDEKAEGYNIVWGGKRSVDFRPTVEFISHLSIHLSNRKRANGHRCVVHTHPIELIAVSHHPVLGKEEEKLNKALWGMLPEIRIYVPRGVALVPYFLPGSKELAEATVRKLSERDVILWQKHGAMATGKNAVEAFDFIDVANKGAMVYLKCLQSGFIPEGLSDEEMDGLKTFF